MTKYHVFEDPSHGWAKVTRKELKRLNLEDKITSYSYQRGEHVYLEEDYDLGLFMRAKQEREEKVEFVEHHTNKQSKIRSYDNYAW